MLIPVYPEISEPIILASEYLTNTTGAFQQEVVNTKGKPAVVWGIIGHIVIEATAINNYFMWEDSGELRLFTSPVDIRCVAGTGTLAYMLPVPIVIEPNARLLWTFNFEASVSSFQLGLIGHYIDRGKVEKYIKKNIRNVLVPFTTTLSAGEDSEYTITLPTGRRFDIVKLTDNQRTRAFDYTLTATRNYLIQLRWIDDTPIFKTKTELVHADLVLDNGNFPNITLYRQHKFEDKYYFKARLRNLDAINPLKLQLCFATIEYL